MENRNSNFVLNGERQGKKKEKNGINNLKSRVSLTFNLNKCFLTGTWVISFLEKLKKKMKKNRKNNHKSIVRPTRDNIVKSK